VSAGFSEGDGVGGRGMTCGMLNDHDVYKKVGGQGGLYLHMWACLGPRVAAIVTVALTLLYR
jgi:hypothetical protein